jgi:hypothetical protein
MTARAIIPKQFGLITRGFEQVSMQNHSIVDVGGIVSFDGFLYTIVGQNVTVVNRSSRCSQHPGDRSRSNATAIFRRSLDVVISHSLRPLNVGRDAWTVQGTTSYEVLKDVDATSRCSLSDMSYRGNAGSESCERNSS